MGGGVDTVLDMYSCQDTAAYNAPRGLNTQREDEQEPWPVCSPQVYSEPRNQDWSQHLTVCFQ